MLHFRNVGASYTLLTALLRSLLMLRHALYTLGYVMAYAALFVLAEQAGYVPNTMSAIPTWHAASGLHLALALLVPAWIAGGAIAVATGVELAFMSAALPPWGIVGIAVVYGGAYVAAARAMQRYFVPPLASLHTARTFLAGALVFPVLLAAFSISAFITMEIPGFEWETWGTLATRWALADSAGILTVAPLGALLGWSMHPAYEKQGITWIEWMPSTSVDRLVYVLEWGLVFLALYGAFFVPALHPPQYYICFLPVLWIALRHGLPATSAAVFVITLGIALLQATGGSPTSAVGEQLFLIVLAAAGLLVGMLISERNRAQSVLAEAGKRLRGYLPPEAVPPVPRTHRPSASSAHVLEQNTDLLATTADQIAALNHELQASQERLRNTLAATNRMMSILSHDLKNPLVGIRGLAEVLDERDDRSERETRMLRLIQQSSQQALDMVENLLMWSRLDTNKMDVDRHRVGLHMMVEECFTLLGGTAQHKRVELVNEVPTALQVHVDPRMVTIALRNFLSNAIKFTGSGGRAAVSAAPVNKNWVLVAVSDTGVGLSEEAQQKLFSSSTGMRSVPGTDGELGTGLGLQLCEEMIRRHHGVVWVESTPGQGTIFYFTLPHKPDASHSPDAKILQANIPDRLALLQG